MARTRRACLGGARSADLGVLEQDDLKRRTGRCREPKHDRTGFVSDLIANLTAFMDHLLGMRPPAVKGNFVRKICVSTTMGPGAFISYGE